MSFIPAGEFTMGSNTGESDQQPAHQIYLDGFYIDQYEVTIAQYKICVAENVCEIPSYASFTHSDYYLNSEYSNYPVINIDWGMAKTFCEWRGARLPTEAEWEKAARGTDARLFPWGNELNSDFVNFNKLYKDTTPVGNFEAGKSPYDVYDMAGNVWEWVQDWYDSEYYENSPVTNPLGPDSGRNRVLRGGSWIVSEDLILATYRDGNGLSNSNLRGTGFRCAISIAP